MSTPSQPHDDILAQIASEGSHPNRRRRLFKHIAVGGLAACALLALVAARAGRRDTGPRFQTEPVNRGDLTVTVSATGNIQPTNQVDVGSEVSGLVESVFVDDNDHVTKGQILARLDVSKLQDQVVNSRAALTAAEARVLQAVATVKESQANLARLRQVAELSGGKVPSKSELETAEATTDRAVADEASARAAVEQARAALSSATISLAKASIRSPINGVVLTREIEPGQTVAASFQAPVLFTLAEDLSQMELQVDVDEADVGQVREGQSATFTVDAYPNRKYPARIRRVGYGSQITDNVVTYKALLTVDNSDLSLRPGMTATAEIITLQRHDVLLVPNAALRFTPPLAVAAGASSGSLVSRLLPRPPRFARLARPANGNGKNGQSKVWVLRDRQPEAIAVTVGATDGRSTEVKSGALQAGSEVITDSAGARS
jgi:HlyD family secretion protein